MKYCFLFFLLVSLNASAQNKPSQSKPSQKQMQEQMEKELKELEKDDPELAKQARAMLNARTQAGETTNAKPPSASAKTASPITPVNLKSPVAAPTAAQATDKLLWFKGKKIDPSTLITMTGTLVRYNKAKNEAIVQPAINKDPFSDMAKELSKNEQRKNEFIEEFAGQKNSFFFYPAIIKSLKEYDNINQRYSSIIKNSITLPPSLSNSTGFLKSGRGGYASFLTYTVNDDIPAAVRKLYNEVIHEMENAPALEIPIPPSREFDVCFDCDTNSQKKYNQAVDNWMDKFWEYERNLTQKAISVQKEIADFRNDAEAEKMWQDMGKANEFAFSRADKKVAMLQEQYGKDFSRVSAIIQLSLGLERQKQLLGAGDTNNNAMEKIISIMDGFDEYMQHQFDIKNYNTVFNIAFIIGMERQKQLLSTSDSREIPFLKTFFAFNRFKLTIDMDFDLMFKDSDGEATLKANGAAGTTQNVYVSLGLIDCKYQMFLTNTDYENAEESEYRIPLTVKSGTKTVKEEHDKWVTYSYSGPKDMLAVFPTSRISFCDNSQPDSMYVEIIRYKADDISGYAQSVKNGYSIDFLGYANNLFMRPSQLEGSTGEAKDIGMEMMKTFSSSQVDQPTGNPKLDQLQSDYNMTVKQQQLQTKLSATAMMPRTLILFDAKNNNGEIIDAETNTAHKEGQMDLVKGIIKVKVVHDPLPYEKPSPRKPLEKTN